MKIKVVLSSLIFAVTVTSAGKFDQPDINILERSSNNNAPVVVNSTPNSSVVLDFNLATGDSWDGQGSPNNVIASCITGGSITGFEWTNVTIATVGPSWLSEATLFFSDSAGAAGIFLTLGDGDDASGSMTYSSGGILDLTDMALPDIVPGLDSLLIVELFESFDDSANAIDANYTSGTITVHGIDLVATPGPSCGFVAAAAAADLQLTITNNAAGVLAQGDSVTFTHTLVNNGPNDANNTVVSGTLSSGLSYVSNDCGATVAGQTITWTVGTLTNGAATSCNVVTTVDGFGQLMVDASVTADETDAVPANNASNSSILGPVRIIPTLSQYGFAFLLIGLFFVARRRFTQ